MFIEFNSELINADLIVSIRKINVNFCVLISLSTSKSTTEYFDTEQERDARYNELKNLLQGKQQ